MSKAYLLLILLLVIPIAPAEGNIFKELISNEGIPNNGICDSGEWVWHSDCGLKDNFFETIWFLRLTILGIILLLIKERKNIDWGAILLVVVIAIFLFYINLDAFAIDINTNSTNITQMPHYNSTWMEWGAKVYGPSNPKAGIAIIIIALIIIGSILMGFHDWIADRTYHKLSKR